MNRRSMHRLCDESQMHADEGGICSRQLRGRQSEAQHDSHTPFTEFSVDSVQSRVDLVETDDCKPAGLPLVPPVWLRRPRPCNNRPEFRPVPTGPPFSDARDIFAGDPIVTLSKGTPRPADFESR